jgi:alpha-beta hydrolase superfamily lysophospholipase
MGAMKQETHWTSLDGLRLYGQVWQPSEEAKAVVCLVHGLGEHSGRYQHVGEALARAGFALLAFDLRGHGKSEGQRGHSPSYEALMDDIAVLLQQAESRYPGKPPFLYGHSLGGNLVINFALRRRPAIAGVIATGPALRTAFEPPGWKISLGKLMYRLWPGLAMANELDRQGLSHDAEVVRAYENDPLVHDRVSARLALDILQSGEWALAHAREFPLPLLLMHGAQDRLTSAAASREFAARAGEKCTLKIWEGFYHEVHNEPEKEEVLDFLVAWLNEHLPQKM